MATSAEAKSVVQNAFLKDAMVWCWKGAVWAVLIGVMKVNFRWGNKRSATITRLRLGVCIFTHGHLFSGSPPPICETCHCRLNVEHVLLYCPRYNLERKNILEYCSKERKPVNLMYILSPKFPVKLIIDYIEDINYSTKIWVTIKLELQKKK